MTDKTDCANIDGGWAWVVLVTSLLGRVMAAIITYMGGVMFIALLDKFHENEANTSLVGAFSSGAFCLSAVFGGIVINTYSCRVVIMAGSVLTTLAFVASTMVPSIQWMILTAGCLAGAGQGLAVAGFICIQGFYFRKRRDFVLSFSTVFPGVGMFISSPFALFVLHHLGLNGLFFVIASMSAQYCLIGALGRPSAIEQEVKRQRRMIMPDAFAKRFKSYFNFSLLKDIPFLLYLFSTSSWNFTLNVSIVHLPNYVTVIGGLDSDIGNVMMAFAVSNIIGRLSGALSINKIRFKSLYVHIGGLVVSGVLTSTFPFYASLPAGIYIFTTQLGFSSGLAYAMMTVISVSFVGITRLTEANGLGQLFCGVGMTVGPFAIGYLYSVTRSYEYSFVAGGVVLLLGSVCGACALCLRKEITADVGSPTEMTADIGSRCEMTADIGGHVQRTENQELLVSDTTVTLSHPPVDGEGVSTPLQTLDSRNKAF